MRLLCFLSLASFSQLTPFTFISQILSVGACVRSSLLFCAFLVCFSVFFASPHHTQKPSVSPKMKKIKVAKKLLSLSTFSLYGSKKMKSRTRLFSFLSYTRMDMNKKERFFPKKKSRGLEKEEEKKELCRRTARKEKKELKRKASTLLPCTSASRALFLSLSPPHVCHKEFVTEQRKGHAAAAT